MTEHEQMTVDAIAGIRRQEYARGVADERARVVAWLRENADELADRIERGEHEGAIPNILIFGFPPVNP